MLKRRFGDRSEWKRVIDREYVQSVLDTEGFKGYITLLKVNKVTEPLYVQYGEEKICIVDDGFKWVQHFPTDKRHSLTTMFNPEGEIVQWYIDICHRVGVENNVPWIDDLFLDIVVLPNGEVFQLDVDELEEARSKNIISKDLYNLAWEETNKLLELIKTGKFELFDMAETHKEYLLKKL